MLARPLPPLASPDGIGWQSESSGKPLLRDNLILLGAVVPVYKASLEGSGVSSPRRRMLLDKARSRLLLLLGAALIVKGRHVAIKSKSVKTGMLCLH